MPWNAEPCEASAVEGGVRNTAASEALRTKSANRRMARGTGMVQGMRLPRSVGAGSATLQPRAPGTQVVLLAATA